MAVSLLFNEEQPFKNGDDDLPEFLFTRKNYPKTAEFVDSMLKLTLIESLMLP